MTPKQIEALKLALEALEWIAAQRTGGMIQRKAMEPIVAIREVLKDHAMQEVQRLGQEIEQEPVAWMFQHDETGRMNYVSNDGIHNPTMFLEMNPRYALVCPLYTAPPQRTWVGLNDDEIDYLIHLAYTGDEEFVQTIEAKLKEKNT